MFKSKVLFVVGAGASQEASLPTGAELKNRIAKKVAIRLSDLGGQESGDRAITDAIRRYIEAQKPARPDIGPYISAGRMIRDAMPLAISIDNYIDAHRDDPRIGLCGKLAIVSSILEAERQSKLYLDPRRVEKMEFDSLANTWYSAFFRLATETIAKDEVARAFANISFISFNYDRCIEHFLVQALMNYYGFDEKGAQTLAQKVVILHPYGQVGSLPWQNGNTRVPFGGQRNEDLIAISAQVKTFTERVEDEAALTALRQQVQDAQTIVFLGFAFHPQNMALITPDKPSNVKRVFATAKGISDSDCKTVATEILDLVKRKSQHVHMELRSGLTCAQLFEEYWRSLSRL